MKIGAGIVTYQPDMDRLRENLNAASEMTSVGNCIPRGAIPGLQAVVNI